MGIGILIDFYRFSNKVAETFNPWVFKKLSLKLRDAVCDLPNA